PNPAQDRIQIRLGGAGVLRYRITDTVGRVVLGGTSMSNDRIDVQELSNGAYVLEVIQGEHRASKQFIKQ
ncbi:MAG TPA: T9SS type A sorting domain-containing protein, partial [Flavobacteriales bacterium]|nr:T9SS type A sorting domain-containing protein [Flavobacteriales bacterium]